MAVEIGIASGHTDLLAKLETFLTTNVDLVAAGQEWEALNTSVVGEKVFKGPGLAGQDEVFIAVSPYEDAINNVYNWDFRYATGHNPTATAAMQPGTPDPVYLTLWNLDIPYWFIANGRRFIVVAKVSTAYACAYGGFILPYGLPSEFPYPICAGANGTNAESRWSTNNGTISSFWFPLSTDTDINAGRFMLRLRDSAGSDIKFCNGGRSNSSFIPEAHTLPYVFNGPGSQTYLTPRTAPDGSYALQPIVLFRYSTDPSVYGEFDGVLHVSGFDNGAENIITVGGVDHLVVQSTLRTGISFYAAIRLE